MRRALNNGTKMQRQYLDEVG